MPEETTAGFAFGAPGRAGCCAVCGRDSGNDAFCSDGCMLAAQDANRLLLEMLKGTLVALYNLCTCAIAALLLPLVLVRRSVRGWLYRGLLNSHRRGELLHILAALAFLGGVIGFALGVRLTDATWRAVTGCHVAETCEVVSVSP